MRKFITTPEVEVIGISALSLMQNLKTEELQPILDKYHLTTIEPDQWYPFQFHLDIFREIAEGHVNNSENLIAIGMKAAQLAPLSPNIKTFEDLLKNYNAAYRMTIRNQPPGDEFLIEFLSAGHVQITNNSPLPDNMTFGAFWGFARRLLPPGTHFLIRPSKVIAPNTDESTVFDVTWNVESQARHVGRSGMSGQLHLNSKDFKQVSLAPGSSEASAF